MDSPYKHITCHPLLLPCPFMPWPTVLARAHLLALTQGLPFTPAWVTLITQYNTHGRQCPEWSSEWTAPTGWRTQCQTQLGTPAQVFQWWFFHNTGPTGHIYKRQCQIWSSTGERLCMCALCKLWSLAVKLLAVSACDRARATKHIIHTQHCAREVALHVRSPQHTSL